MHQAEVGAITHDKGRHLHLSWRDDGSDGCQRYIQGWAKVCLRLQLALLAPAAAPDLSPALSSASCFSIANCNCRQKGLAGCWGQGARSSRRASGRPNRKVGQTLREPSVVDQSARASQFGGQAVQPGTHTASPFRFGRV